MRISITASLRLNPAESGESLATTVRIYQLRDAAKLLETTLDRILDNDRAVLGEDFVAVQELTLYPGEMGGARPQPGRGRHGPGRGGHVAPAGGAIMAGRAQVAGPQCQLLSRARGRGGPEICAGRQSG